MTTESSGRRVLVLAHTGRAEVREVARECVHRLTGHGTQLLTRLDGIDDWTRRWDTARRESTSEPASGGR